MHIRAKKIEKVENGSLERSRRPVACCVCRSDHWATATATPIASRSGESCVKNLKTPTTAGECAGTAREGPEATKILEKSTLSINSAVLMEANCSVY